ncbi:Uncharacterised protein [Edwardsiella tarda]|nr:Uncharacterised protein [Edwardsiella tarda]
MTKQIAFEQPAGNGGTVHLHHAFLIPQAKIVDSLGNQLLAGPRLPRINTLQSLAATISTCSSTLRIASL